MKLLGLSEVLTLHSSLMCNERVYLIRRSKNLMSGKVAAILYYRNKLRNILEIINLPRVMLAVIL